MENLEEIPIHEPRYRSYSEQFEAEETNETQELPHEQDSSTSQILPLPLELQGSQTPKIISEPLFVETAAPKPEVRNIVQVINKRSEQGAEAVRKYQNVKSKVHSTQEDFELSEPLKDAIEAFSVKCVEELRSNKNPSVSLEILASAFMGFFGKTVTNKNTWTAFVDFLKQPGAVVQKIRQLPREILSNPGNIDFERIKQLMTKIDPENLQEQNSK